MSIPNYRYAFARLTTKIFPPILAQRIRNLIYPFETAARDNFEFTIGSVTGSKFGGQIGDFMAYRMGVHGYSTWRNVAIASALCKHGDSIIEAGANIGTETISFSDIVGETGTVIAFEPFPDNFEKLKIQIQSNNLTQVRAYPYAVSDISGQLEFVCPPGKNSGTGYINKTDCSENPTVFQVKSVTLDSIMQDCLPAAKMIVMDIEGAEILALRGANCYINKWRPIIIVEANPTHIKRSGFTLRDLYDELGKHDYTSFLITSLGLSRIDRSETLLPRGDWLSIPNEAVKSAREVKTAIRLSGLLPVIPGINPLARRSRAPGNAKN